MDRFKEFIINMILIVIKAIDYCVPKKQNSVIFYSSPDFTDNSRALYEEMINQGLDKKYNITWVVKDVDRLKSYGIRANIVKHKSLTSLWAFCRSKYIVRTHSLFGNIYIKKRQIMCFSFHGMPFKSIQESERKKIIRNNYDYLSSTSEFFVPKLAYMMNSSDEKLNIVTGLPRNDFMFHGEGLLKVLGFDHFDKIIIWMPTFRKSKSWHCDGKPSEFGLPTLIIEDLQLLNDVLKQNNILLILKLHHFAIESLGKINYSNIKNINDNEIPYPYSLYHLLGQTDVLLTDYSSVYIDYLMLNRPIGFIFNDIDEYASTRGFMLNPALDFMPGEKISNITELIEFINDVSLGKDKFKKDRDNTIKIFHKYLDDKSSQRYLNEVGIK